MTEGAAGVDQFRSHFAQMNRAQANQHLRSSLRPNELDRRPFWGASSI